MDLYVAIEYQILMSFGGYVYFELNAVHSQSYCQL
jgi:hypothetical protein